MSLQSIRAVPSLLRKAVRGALQWRVLLLWVLLGWIPTALATVPLWRTIADLLDHSVHAQAWARQLDAVMFFEMLGRLRLEGQALGGAGIGAALVFLLLLPLLNALQVAAVRSVQPLKLGALLHAGLQEYGPNLRLLLMGCIPLGVAMAAFAGAGYAVKKATERAILPDDPDLLAWSLRIGATLVLLFALATVDAGRARLAFEPRRRSAVKAWWRGVKLVSGNPLRSLLVYLLLFLIAALLLAALTVVRLEVSAASVPGLLVGWLAVQCIATLAAWLHFARLWTMFELVRLSAAAPTPNRSA